MKTLLVKLTLIAGGAVLASHAIAQSPVQPGSAAATTVPRALASTPWSPTETVTAAAAAAANIGAASPTPVKRMVTAAGSVIILVDGKVAQSTIAQIHPPAQGFMYER